MPRYRTAYPPEFRRQIGSLVRTGEQGEPERVYRFMRGRQAIYHIHTMARVLKVSASGYYAWRSRPVSARATADADLTRRIRTIHAGSHGTYGAPRVHAELKADSLSVGRKRIARLMRAAGVASVSWRRSAPVTTRQATDHYPANDLVRRNFMAERPNALWLADIPSCPRWPAFSTSRSFSTPGHAGSAGGPSRSI
jgi:putative transposase